MNFPDQHTLFIRDALRAYKRNLERLAGEKEYHLKTFLASDDYLIEKDDVMVDRRVMLRDRYLLRIQTCDELLQLINSLTPD